MRLRTTQDGDSSQQETAKIASPRSLSGGPGRLQRRTMKQNNNCVCHSGVINSVAGEDIAEGDLVFAAKEGSGESRIWVTRRQPVQRPRKKMTDRKEGTSNA